MALKARIFVTPRRDVLDPQGDAVEGALHSLGFSEVRGVHIGRYLEVDLEGDDHVIARARLRFGRLSVSFGPV